MSRPSTARGMDLRRRRTRAPSRECRRPSRSPGGFPHRAGGGRGWSLSGRVTAGSRLSATRRRGRRSPIPTAWLSCRDGQGGLVVGMTLVLTVPTRFGVVSPRSRSRRSHGNVRYRRGEPRRTCWKRNNPGDRRPRVTGSTACNWPNRRARVRPSVRRGTGGLLPRTNPSSGGPPEAPRGLNAGTAGG